MTNRSCVDIVVPVFNEEGILEAFHGELDRETSALGQSVTIYYVNDGSTDATAERLLDIARRDPRVVVVELSRNFGHQAALSAGLDQSRGDVVITMDGDGQHPPAMIPEMLRLSESGYDVVIAQRVAGDTPAPKRWTSLAFYWLLNRLSDTSVLPGAADFRLMTRPVVDALRAMPEYHRFLRGMVAWLGYRTVILPYAEAQRAGGRSKYTMRKMLRLAGDAIFSFSLVPLRIGIGLGMLFLALAAAEVLYVLSFWWRGRWHELARGWSSLMLMVLLVGGILMVLVGFIGVYVGYIFQEVKRRPVYVVRSTMSGGPRLAGSDGQD
jgi:dolichol-phosphate mannosyltransferase